MGSFEFESVLRRCGLSDELAHRIVWQEMFTEDSFLKITAVLLRALGFNGSEILEILEVQNKLPPSTAADESDTPEPTHDELLQPYFIHYPQRLREMSDYEKKPLVEQLKRWKDAVAKEPSMADIIKPPFVADFEKETARLDKKNNKRAQPLKEQQQLGEPSPKRPVRSCTSLSRSLSQKPAAAGSSNSESRSSSTMSSASCSSASSSQETTSASSNSSSNSQFKLTLPNATPSTSKSSSTLALDSLIEKNRAAVNKTTATSQISWCKENIVPKFDVKEQLTKKLIGFERGQAILNQLEENTQELSTADRKLVVRQLTKWLYKGHVSDPKEVTSSMKEELAKSIAVTFPKTFWVESENAAPWINLFDKKDNTGFIVNAARPIQQKNKQRKSKKSKESATNKSAVPNEDPADGIDRLGLIVPANKSETKQEILRGMSKYFDLRNTERNEGQTITFFLKKYIHFTSYGGEVILEEFDKMHPNVKNNLPSRLLNMTPKILSLPLKRDTELSLNDKTLLALVILSQYLPHDIPKKTDGKVDHSDALEKDLIVVLQTKDNVDDYIIDTRNKAKGTVQPYLILIKSDLDEEIVRYFLVLECKAVELSCVNLSSAHATLQAFDILMKTFIVFNVHHPYGWRNTLYFVQHYFLGVEEHFTGRGKRCKVSPTQAGLWAKLNRIEV